MSSDYQDIRSDTQSPRSCISPSHVPMIARTEHHESPVPHTDDSAATSSSTVGESFERDVAIQVGITHDIQENADLLKPTETLLTTIESQIRTLMELQETCPKSSRSHNIHNNTNAASSPVRQWLTLQKQKLSHIGESNVNTQNPNNDANGGGSAGGGPLTDDMYLSPHRRTTMPFGFDPVDRQMSYREVCHVLLAYTVLPTVLTLGVMFIHMAVHNGAVVTCSTHCTCTWDESALFFLTIGMAPRLMWVWFPALLTIACMLGSANRPKQILFTRKAFILIVGLLYPTLLFHMYVAAENLSRKLAWYFIEIIEVVFDVVPIAAAAILQKQFRHCIPVLCMILVPWYYYFLLVRYSASNTPIDFVGAFIFVVSLLEIIYSFAARQMFPLSSLNSTRLMVLLSHGITAYPIGLKLFVLFCLVPTDSPGSFTANILIYFCTELMIRSNFADRMLAVSINHVLRCAGRQLQVHGADRFDCWGASTSGTRKYCVMVESIVFLCLYGVKVWPQPSYLIACSGDTEFPRTPALLQVLGVLLLLVAMEVILGVLGFWRKWGTALGASRNTVWTVLLVLYMVVCGITTFGWASVVLPTMKQAA